jgi:hypothetical protein
MALAERLLLAACVLVTCLISQRLLGPGMHIVTDVRFEPMTSGNHTLGQLSNLHMEWYQGTTYPNIGRPGFLSFHCSVRYFLMVQDEDQIRPDWKTNEVFDKFSKHVVCITNPKLKHPKEGMVEAFLKKMRMQIQKHNKRYILLTRDIVHSVFAEWQTGQAVAQVLKGGEGLPSLSPPFFSNQHD